MKKTIFVGIICLLISGIPFSSAISVEKLINIKSSYNNEIEQIVPTLEDVPPWANGNFTGVWGITVFGIPTPPLGWVAGYYQEIGLGTLAGAFAPFTEPNATGTISGFMLWIFFMGEVIDNATGNNTYVAGIGVANETHYYMRLNGIAGPNYYMLVEYTRFEE
jgi:hypothetical protein